jgi:hypothetical protein
MFNMNNLIGRITAVPIKNISQTPDQVGLQAIYRLQRFAGWDRKDRIEERSRDWLSIIVYGPAPGLQGLRISDIAISRSDSKNIHNMAKAG